MLRGPVPWRQVGHSGPISEPGAAGVRSRSMTRFAAWGTLALTLAFALSPLLTEPFSGFREDQLPIPQIEPPVQPAGYAFSIWGLIYGWLVVSALFGVLRRAGDAGWDRARLPLMGSLAIGAVWLWVANQSAVWATVTIFAMAGTALLALFRTPGGDRWWLQAPVAIYAGWLSAASFVSLASVGAGYGVIAGSVGWALIGIAAALALAASVQWRLARAPEYAATVIWALVGIVVANGTAEMAVSVLAAAGVALMATVALARG